MFHTPFDNDLMDNCDITIKIGHTIIQTLTLPMVLARMQFDGIIRQLVYDYRPIQISCTSTEYSESGKELVNSLVFSNNAYLKFEENK